MSGLPTGSGLEILGEVLASPPSDVEEFNPVTVSPGLPGFITVFLLAAVVVLLMLDMTRRVRRVQATERVEQRMAAERAEQEGTAQGPSAEDPAGTDGTADSGEDAPKPDDGAADLDVPSADPDQSAGEPDDDAGTDTSRSPRGD